MKSSNRKRIAGMSWLIGVALLATGCATQQALDTAARTAAETAARAAAEEAGRNNDEAKEAKIIKTRFEACKSINLVTDLSEDKSDDKDKSLNIVNILKHSTKPRFANRILDCLIGPVKVAGETIDQITNGGRLPLAKEKKRRNM